MITINIYFSDDIKIKFYELDESDVEIWSDYGLFTERNIHHNYTIGFRYIYHHTLFNKNVFNR